MTRVATAEHHKKMARAFRDHGQEENAKAADRAAQLCDTDELAEVESAMAARGEPEKQLRFDDHDEPEGTWRSADMVDLTYGDRVAGR